MWDTGPQTRTEHQQTAVLTPSCPPAVATALNAPLIHLLLCISVLYHCRGEKSKSDAFRPEKMPGQKTGACTGGSRAQSLFRLKQRRGEHGHPLCALLLGSCGKPALVHCSGEQEGWIQPGDGCGAVAATVLGCRDGLRVCW